MDPITVYQLGQIRQRELLESCLRDQLGDEIEQRPVSLLRRVISLISTLNTRDNHVRTRQTAYRDNFAASR